MKKFAACIACIIGCIENIVNYVTNRTYIMIAIKGKGYCRSASTGMFKANLKSSFIFLTYDLF